MQMMQPQITHVKEDWGVFLVSPKAMPSGVHHNFHFPQPVTNHQHSQSSHINHHIKTVQIELDKQKVLLPTTENLKKLDKNKAKMNNHMQGSIMGQIFDEITQKKSQAKSMAISNTSAFSTMKTGAFFKMVNSPFKINMMHAYEKMQTKNLNDMGGSTAKT